MKNKRAGKEAVDLLNQEDGSLLETLWLDNAVMQELRSRAAAKGVNLEALILKFIKDGVAFRQAGKEAA